jgi:hypothetical protein
MPVADDGAARRSCAALLSAFAQHGRSDAQCILTPFERKLCFLSHGAKLGLRSRRRIVGRGYLV